MSSNEAGTRFHVRLVSGATRQRTAGRAAGPTKTTTRWTDAGDLDWHRHAASQSDARNGGDTGDCGRQGTVGGYGAQLCGAASGISNR